MVCASTGRRSRQCPGAWKANGHPASRALTSRFRLTPFLGGLDRGHPMRFGRDPRHDPPATGAAPSPEKGYGGDSPSARMSASTPLTSS